MAVQFGCHILDGFPVTKISPGEPDNDSPVTVFGRSKNLDQLSSDVERSFTAKSVVVCAGPWTKTLLDPLGWV